MLLVNKVYLHVASVIDEWAQSSGGKIKAGANRSTGKKTCPIATSSPTLGSLKQRAYGRVK